MEIDLNLIIESERKKIEEIKYTNEMNITVSNTSYANMGQIGMDIDEYLQLKSIFTV